MKTNTSESSIKAIVTALEKLHIRPFSSQSSDPKSNAQKNLKGKTFYVEDDTLRFHHSRVLSCRELHGGLLLRVVCSDAMDPDNKKRGFRAVVFDLFGTTIFRPKLDECVSTKQRAFDNCEEVEIDLIAHYRAAITSELKQREEAVLEMRAALESLPV